MTSLTNSTPMVAAASAPARRPTEVHPLAELFPMMAPEDLDALSENIKANGLRSAPDCH
jgi:hypothetical protein